MVVPLGGLACQTTSVAPCAEPQLWYAPYNDERVHWGCEPPNARWHADPFFGETVDEEGMSLEDALDAPAWLPGDTGDTGFLPAETFEEPEPTGDTGFFDFDTAETAETADTGGVSQRDTADPDTSTGDTALLEDTFVDDTAPTGDTGLLPEPVDTGLPFETADTGVVREAQ